MEGEVREIIEKLLAHLPDSRHDDESWEWCWNELGWDAQEAVSAVRRSAIELLMSMESADSNKKGEP